MSTKIMGQAQASIEQMRAYIKKVNPKVPEPVIKMIPYYITEGALEGVRETLLLPRAALRLVTLPLKAAPLHLIRTTFAVWELQATESRETLLKLRKRESGRRSST